MTSEAAHTITVNGPDQGSSAQSPVVVVTGAASGIGRATASAFGRIGRRVVCADIDGDGTEATVDAITKAGGTARAVTVDVADDDACRRAVASAAEFGRLQTLVNVAGVLPVDDRIDLLSPQVWDHTMAVNVRSVYSMTRHAVPHLRRYGGVIVNTTSVHAFATMPSSAAYAASKGAVLSLTRQLALDLTGDGIRVVAVAPGSVDTPMSRRSLDRTGGSSLADLGFDDDPRAVGRVGAPEEIAAAIVWLASPEAGFVNGTCLTVDGALLARLV